MLNPIPTTSWFARTRTLSTACTTASATADATPSSRPMNGLPDSLAPSAPMNAEVNIIPSRLRFRTPACSLTISPVAASTSGVARRSDDATNTASVSIRGPSGATAPRPWPWR